MVVTYSTFIERRRSTRLDASNKSEFNEGVQGVIDGLTRDCADITLCDFYDFFGSRMWSFGNRAQYRQALSGDVHSAIFEQVLVNHCGADYDQICTESKLWAKSP